MEEVEVVEEAEALAASGTLVMMPAALLGARTDSWVAQLALLATVNRQGARQAIRAKSKPLDFAAHALQPGNVSGMGGHPPLCMR